MQANELFTQPNTILLDGGMGTMLQAAGLKLGARPEELNITDPQLIESIHSRYAAAGSRIINANTFGASAQGCVDHPPALQTRLQPEPRQAEPSNRQSSGLSVGEVSGLPRRPPKRLRLQPEPRQAAS